MGESLNKNLFPVLANLGDERTRELGAELFRREADGLNKILYVLFA